MMRPLFLVAVFCLLATPLAAQPPNLASNGDFDGSIAGWTIAGDGLPGDPTAVSIADVDALGLEDSDAARIADPATITFLDQCIEIDPAVRRYTNGVSVSGDPIAALRLQFFFDTACQNPSSGAGGRDLDEFSADFVQMINTHPETSVPAGSSSALLRFGREDGVGVENLFDKAFLIEGLPEDYPPLTAEIELVSGSGLTIQLGGAATGGFVPFEAEYRWDFGDGTTAIGSVVSHTYAAPGTYFVELVAFRGDFDQDFAGLEVTVPLPTDLDIPTLDEIGLGLLALLLLMAALVSMRRHS